MRRRAILAGIAGSAGAMLAQQIGVLAQPLLPGDDDGTATPPPQPPPPQNDPPSAPATPSVPTAPAAPVAPAKPVATKPDLSDPKYSPNAYPPLKKTLDGPPKSGEFALTADDLNLRVNPSYNSDVATVIPGGSQITIEGKIKDGFFPVNFQSGLGWADGKFSATPRPGNAAADRCRDADREHADFRSARPER